MKHRRNIYWDDELWERIKHCAEIEGITSSDFVRRSVKRAVELEETHEALGPRKRGE